MRNIFRILIILALIGVASAAVYITYNPEARIYFGLDKPGPDVESIQVLVGIPNSSGWTNSIEYTPDKNGVMDIPLAFKNHEPIPITGVLKITLTCDEGVFMQDDGTVFDIDSMIYRAPGLTEYECDQSENIHVIGPNEVEFHVGNIIEYPPEEHIFGNLYVDMVGMAFGNYTLFVLVEEV